MTTIVLFGGASDERHVSVASAQNVVRALGGPLCWFWAPQGAVHDVAVDDLLSHQRPFEIDFHPKRPAIWPNLEQALDTLPVDDPVFFLALHGTGGEDGVVQKMMEDRAIPFNGSGSAASAAAFDKGRAKEIVKGRVLVAESRTVRTAAEIVSIVREMLERYPRLVLKPLAGGSSRGLFFLDRSGDAQDVVAKVNAMSGGQAIPPVPDRQDCLSSTVPYLVEQFIEGRELTIGVVDQGDGPFALPVIEIEVDPGSSFDYEGKYLGKGTREICPAKIPDVVRDAAQQTALTAHVALGCKGYSRTDVISAKDGIYFLELNSLPGLTISSLVPQELREAGIDFREFLERQIALARQRSVARSSS